MSVASISGLILAHRESAAAVNTVENGAIARRRPFVAAPLPELLQCKPTAPGYEQSSEILKNQG